MTIEEDCNDLILLMLLIDFIIDQCGDGWYGEFPKKYEEAQFIHLRSIVRKRGSGEIKGVTSLFSEKAAVKLQRSFSA